MNNEANLSRHVLSNGTLSVRSLIVGLTVKNWNGATNGNCAEQIKFGSNQFGLTSAHLGRVRFNNPVGFSAGDDGARILNTGEVVPVLTLQSTLVATRDGNELIKLAGGLGVDDNPWSVLKRTVWDFRSIACVKAKGKVRVHMQRIRFRFQRLVAASLLRATHLVVGRLAFGVKDSWTSSQLKRDWYPL